MYNEYALINNLKSLNKHVGRGVYKGLMEKEGDLNNYQVRKRSTEEKKLPDSSFPVWIAWQNENFCVELCDLGKTIAV